MSILPSRRRIERRLAQFCRPSAPIQESPRQKEGLTKWWK